MNKDQNIAAFPALKKSPERELYPVSRQQEGVFLQAMLDPGNTLWNSCHSWRYAGDLKIDAFEKALLEIINRQASLRTNFLLKQDKIFQVIRKDPSIDRYFKFVDLSTRPGDEAEKEAAARSIEQEEAKKPYDLSSDPLIRFTLVRFNESDHLIIISKHHIIFDVTSRQLLWKELAPVYNAYAANRSHELGPPPLQYYDYAAWQQEFAASPHYRRQKDYWLSRLAGNGTLPLLDLPTDSPREENENNKKNRPRTTASEQITLSPELGAKLRTFSLRSRVSFSSVFLSAYYILLYKYTGQRDMVIGTLYRGRNLDKKVLSKIIGLFANRIAMRLDMEETLPIRKLLAAVDEQVRGAYKNQDYLFEDLIRTIHPQRTTTHAPIFQVVFNMIKVPAAATGMLGLTEIEWQGYQLDTNISSQYDLSLYVSDDFKNINISILYSEALFKEQTIKRILAHYNNILNYIIKQPGQELPAVEFITGEEKRQLLFDFNNTGRDYPADRTIHELFAEQAESKPDHIAAVGAKHSDPRQNGNASPLQSAHLSCRELKKRSGQLAYLLKEKGVEPGTIVGLMVRRTTSMFTGILGILEAGGAYLPLDPEFPGERIEYMLTHSEAKILLTTRSLFKEVDKFSSLGVENVFIEDCRGEALPFYSGNECFAPTSLAYVIYTSGSTGKPKGVMIAHRAVHNFIIGITEKIDFSPNKTILALTTISFDIFVLETLLPLCRGLRIVIADENQQKNVPLLAEVIEKTNLDMLQATPTRMQLFTMNKDGDSCLKNLKEIMVGGEAFPEKLLKDLKRLTSARIYNMYGPTETTIWSTVKDLTEAEKITIGQPIANTQIYILDKYANLQPVGVVGELCIAGHGLAKGYYKNPKLTAEKFASGEQGGAFRENCPPAPPAKASVKPQANETANPVVGARRAVPSEIPSPGFRGAAPRMAEGRGGLAFLYKTGDLAKWLPNGDIECLGRIDNQVKIRGFRIELGEIETVLNDYPGIREAAAAAVNIAGEQTDGKSLCAYVVADGKIETLALREYLSKKLPHYMIPSYFVQLKKLPLTENQKIDRKALPVPGSAERIAGESTYEVPQDDIQQKLASAFQEVLGLKRVGINDNFFVLGGESIKAMQVASKLSVYGYNLDIADLFKHPAIKDLSKHVTTTCPEIEQESVSGNINLTPVQKWFIERDFTGRHYWNQSVLLYRKEGFDKEILKKVSQRILEHHDVLRAVLSPEGRVLINKGAKDDSIEKYVHLEVFDFTAGENDPDSNLKNRIKQESERIQASIDLYNGPLIKTALFKTAAGDHLLIVIHHLLVDGISWRILFADISSGYEQALTGREIEFPAKSHSFKQWGETLQAYSRSEKLLQEYDYWQEICGRWDTGLFSSPSVEREKAKLADYSRYEIELDKEETQSLLTEVNKAYNTEINDILLSGLSLTLRDFFGCENFIINLEGHGRERIPGDVDLDITRTVGWFTAVFPVLLEAREEDDLSKHIRRTKENLRKIPHKGIGYGLLRYLSQLPAADREKLAIEPEIVFNYLGRFDEDLERTGFSRSKYSAGHSKNPASEQVYKININGEVKNEKLTFTINCGHSAFGMENFAAGFKGHLQEIIKHCGEIEETVYTPADFDAKDLSFAELETIYGCFGSNSKNISKIYDLSAMQQGMLFHYLYEPGRQAYTVQLVYSLAGQIGTALFKESYERLVDKYDVLRTAFVYKNLQQPRQVVLREREKEFVYFDLTRPADENEYIKIAEIKNKDRERGFDLLQDILMRFTLIKRDKEKYELLMTYHHIIMDGWSTNLLLQDFVNIYHQLKQGNTPQTAAAGTYSYIDYIRWLAEQDNLSADNYWRNYLSGFDRVTGLQPYHRENIAGVEEYKKGDYTITIDRQMRDRLSQAAHRLNVTPNNLIQGIWCVILQRYTGADDIVFGNVISGRNVQLQGIDRIAGLFINTIPLRVRIKENHTFAQLVQEIAQNLIESLRYGFMSLADIQAHAVVEGQLFDHLYIYENYPVEREIRSSRLAEKTGFKITGRSSTEHTNYHLNLIVIPREDLLLRCQYNEHVYDASFAASLVDRIEHVLSRAALQPQQPVSGIEIITKEEKQRLLYEFNNTAAAYPAGKTIHGLFDEQVDKTPDNIAMVGAKHSVPGQNGNASPQQSVHITYRELKKKSAHLSRLLQAKGITPGAIVGIMIERSVEMITGIFGIEKAGAAYLPLDPGYPGERINYMLCDSGAKLLLTTRSVFEEEVEKLRSLEVENVFIEDCRGEALPFYSGNECFAPTNLAYVIYTSGSTGKPKGVMIKHRAVHNFIIGITEKINFSPGKVILALTTISFDIFVLETLLSFSRGLRVVMAEENQQKNVQLLAELIEKTNVDMLQATPSRMQLFTMNRHGESCLKNIKEIMVGGEAFPEKLLKDLKRLTAAKIYNMYGPTETTVWSALKDLTAVSKITIGQPIANTQIYILDKNFNLQPVNLAGELYIAGDGLARGYLNRPELTAEKFVKAQAASFKPQAKAIGNPVVGARRAVPSEILYKTGDLCRWLPDGSIEFLDRIDNQVKIRGNRIELGEIESVLNKQPNIRDAVVVLLSDDHGEKSLCAYMVSEKALTIKELREQLQKELPTYMIPSYFVPLDKIPLTANGKLNRKALPTPDQQMKTGTKFEAPRDETEEKLTAIWKDILKVKKVGIRDNFFELGGHSLKVMALAAAVNKIFGVELPLREIFDNPTIAGIAEPLREDKEKKRKFDRILQEIESLSPEQVQNLLEDNSPCF